MKLSVIVPCYNGEKHIKRCIQSLLEQGIDHGEYEIIFINDGSTDRSAAIAAKYAEAYPHLIHHNQENRGLGYSRNRGMQMARGDYIYFLDVDDYLAGNTLGGLLETAFKHDLDLIGFRTKVTEKLDLTETPELGMKGKAEVTSGFEFIEQHKSHRYEAWWYILRRDFLDRIKVTFEEGKYFEDVIFTLKTLVAAKKMIFVPVEIHRYVQHDTSIKSLKNPSHVKKLVEDKVYLIYKITSLINDRNFIKSRQTLLSHIKFVRSTLLYFMFFTVLQSSLSLGAINKLLKELKKRQIYPMDHFSGFIDNNLKVKISIFIFNHKLLFLFLLYPLRFLIRTQILKVPR